ncbi:DNase I-like protein, partial [Exidia glandulosa HHB12029]
MCSPDPENPTGKGGVGVVLNKRLVRTQGAHMWEVVAGRAIVVSVDWHRQQKLVVLAVYAPNDHRENKEFWTEIRETLARRADIPKPRALLGDFNMVESSADRFPSHLNGADMSAEFQELLTYLDMIDGWKEINPRRFNPTWHDAAATTYARLDRIYVTENIFMASRAWKVEDIRGWCPGADHLPVCVDLINPSMPFVGEGRWSMGLKHLRDRQLFKELVETGKEVLANVDKLMEKPRLPDDNVQHAVANWKEDVAERSKARAREEGQKRERILRALENEKKEILQD